MIPEMADSKAWKKCKSNEVGGVSTNWDREDPKNGGDNIFLGYILNKRLKSKRDSLHNGR